MRSQSVNSSREFQDLILHLRPVSTPQSFTLFSDEYFEHQELDCVVRNEPKAEI
jgi:hypothetical protein